MSFLRASETSDAIQWIVWLDCFVANSIRSSQRRLWVVLLCLFPAISHANDIKPYPRDVRVAFITSCATSYREMIAPCRCMINQLERIMPLEEFVAFSKMPDPTQDKRFTTAANACIGRQR